jgi:phospholipid/cholesterol/gamma-HCH transport system substrate-binding protein
MEMDKHYFFEGLFVIGLGVGIALFFVWLENAGHRDDVVYRINFGESVSGLALGDPVKFRGVNVGTVKAMALDPEDPRRVRVDVALGKETPVRTDTRASLRLKGLTGVVLIELNGGGPRAKALLDVTPAGQVPEIVAEKSPLTSVLDQLPVVIAKLSALEDDTRKMVGDVSEVTGRVKESKLFRIVAPSKDKDKGQVSATPENKPREKK